MELKKIFLLDTNIISEAPKPIPSEKVITKLEMYTETSVISATVWFEILKGIHIMPESSRKTKLEKYAYNTIQEAYDILPYDSHCASIQADIYAKMLENGTPVPVYDMQIAATAIANNLILVTRNIKDFEPIRREYSLMIENWFE